MNFILNNLTNKILVFLLTWLSLVAISGSIVYWFFGLSSYNPLLVASLSLVLAAFFTFYYFKDQEQEKGKGNEKEKRREREREEKKITQENSLSTRLNKLAIVFYLLNFFLGVVFLFLSRSDEPLISPWQVIPIWHFVTYFLASFTLLYLSLKNNLSIILISLHALWTFSIILIIYLTGYGFDPFIHQAAIKAIMENGQIEPLTPYYLGQYSLVIILKNLFGQSVVFWDKILVPLLAAIFLPWTIWHGLKKIIRSKTLKISLLLLFALPAGFFIVTTPQHLSYLFLIITIFWALAINKRIDLILLWLLAFTSAVIQPIAGLPALLIAGFGTLNYYSNYYSQWQESLKKILYSLGIILSVFGLPTVLYLFTKTGSQTAMTLGYPQWSLFNFLIPKNPITESWWLNGLYFYESIIWLIFALLIIFGIYLAYKKRLEKIIKLSLWPGLSFILSAIILSALDFAFLIDYERSDYPKRLLVVAALVMLPLVILSLNKLAKKLIKEKIGVQLSFIIMLSFFLTASLYLSYPRQDRYHNSRGYTATQVDIRAVEEIDKMSQGKDYLVLSNQQVSAASLRVFGFKKYYHENLFYYPIPTGGELYGLYLTMIENPNKETMLKAMDKAGVDLAYFVLNDYWWAFEKIKDEAGLIADNMKDIDNKVYIFEFRRD